MKKRIASTLHFDASCKEVKRLHQCKETSAFKGLPTGANSFGEV